MLRIQVFFDIAPKLRKVYAIFVHMRIKVLFFFILAASVVFGQDEISWSGGFDKKNNKAYLTAELKKGWHVYSMLVDEMKGPVSTKFELKKNRYVEILGEIQEPEPKVSFDENFGAELQYLEKTVTFEQELKIKKSTKLEYVVTFMICNDVMCYPPVDDVVLIPIKKN